MEFSKQTLKSLNSDKIVLNRDKLREILKAEKIFLSLGLTREYKGEFYEMVIGFHTIPDYNVKIDYNNL
tara:strand:- start:4135 stop:4341 length:207 start_codon:yes stop_codon:yes gene_type:complete